MRTNGGGTQESGGGGFFFFELKSKIKLMTIFVCFVELWIRPYLLTYSK